MNKTITLRIDPYTLKRIDTLLSYKRADYPTRSSFINEAIEEYLRSLESHLKTKLKGNQYDLLKEDLLACKKFKKKLLDEKRKKEISRSLNSYFSATKAQKFIDHESYEVARWVYDKYAILCEESRNPLTEPLDPRFNI